VSRVPKSRAGTRECYIIQQLENSCCIEKYEMISGKLNMEVIRLKDDMEDKIMKSTSYDGASLRSPILEKGVMLGVLP
jgi:hypothetical protein